MPYYYIDASRENESHALPDVEVFYDRVSYSDCCRVPATHGYAHSCESVECPSCNTPAKWHDIDDPETHGWRYWYAFGFPGYHWESDPNGPYDSEESALTAAREESGYCAHGVSDDAVCEDCPAPELWTLADVQELLAVGCPNPPFPTTMTKDWRRCICWNTRENAEKSIAHFTEGLPELHPVKLPDDAARRWGKTE